MRHWLWFCLCIFSVTPLAATRFDVLAVEYPPFTTSKMADGGLAFQVLRQAFPDYRFKPMFVPPKRAYTMMQQGHWCLSFYPSPAGMPSNKIVLSEHQIVIGVIRLRQDSPLKWQQLSEFSGLRVALLRSGDNSPFATQFTQAGLQITYTETTQQSLDLLLRKRVDLAMYDDYNFNKLPTKTRDLLQFSDNHLLQTPVTLFTNPSCNDPLPKAVSPQTLPAALGPANRRQQQPHSL